MNGWQSQGIAIPRWTPAVRAVMIATGAAFVLQVLGDRLTGGAVSHALSLSLAGLCRGMAWQILTYLLLHGGLFHLLLNMMALFFFGPDVERIIGPRRFVGLYLACGALGGAGWILISGMQGAACIGASGAVFGILGAFAAFFPDRPVTLLVFFVLPVTLLARSLALILGLVTLVSLFSQDGNIAPAAHLAGGIAGYLYGRRLSRRHKALRFPGSRWWPRIRTRGARDEAEEFFASDAPPSPDQVDRILDKISADGFGSLSRAQRDLLERAGKDTRRAGGRRR